jgi:L-2,4-diaminobutyric acid acetyltransferase
MVFRTDSIRFDAPDASDGPALEALAREAGGLDVNSTYAYALWAKEFWQTSVTVRSDEALIAFLTAFRRPSAPDTLFVWQMAVDPAHRGARLGLRMLHELSSRVPDATTLEATVTTDNHRSLTTFQRFADDRDGPLSIEPLFDQRQLGAGHAPEHLLRIVLPPIADHPGLDRHAELASLPQR